jgi:NitT/TauT family transport system substrate-binding protein
MKALNLLLFNLILSTLFLFGCSKQEAKIVKIRFGTLPVMQALPIYVAQSQGFFGEAGIDVEVIPFNNSGDKDIALTTGNIDGQFADLFTPVVIESNGQDIVIVATNYETKHDKRMFAVLGKPDGGYRSAIDLKNVPIALSSNTVIHNMTETILIRQGLSIEELMYVESKNIGIRMQMLLTGQVEAATLPEPLVSAAVAKGATVIADDTGYPLSQTVLLFSEKYISQHPEAVKKFLKAAQRAVDFIDNHPDETRLVMVENVRLPEPLKAVYPIPKFPKLHVPDRVDIERVVEWLHTKDVIEQVLPYEDLVDGRYLP